MPGDEGSYLYPGERPSAEPFQVTVLPGPLWVMGDNRADSADSRDHPDDPGDGTIPESAVVGRAIAIVWPPSQVTTQPFPPFSRSRDWPGRQRRPGGSGAVRPGARARRPGGGARPRWRRRTGPPALGSTQ
jgi:hypothetical protein